jgi:acid stress chaperone HdeA
LRLLVRFVNGRGGVQTIAVSIEGRPTMKATATVAMVVAALLFSGCSVSQVINTGGDTKCKDFITQDEKKRTEEVRKMLKDSTLKDKSGAAPTTADIDTTRSAAVTYCQTVGKPDQDSKISEAPLR